MAEREEGVWGIEEVIEARRATGEKWETRGRDFVPRDGVENKVVSDTGDSGLLLRHLRRYTTSEIVVGACKEMSG